MYWWPKQKFSGDGHTRSSETSAFPGSASGPAGLWLSVATLAALSRGEAARCTLGEAPMQSRRCGLHASWETLSAWSPGDMPSAADALAMTLLSRTRRCAGHVTASGTSRGYACRQYLGSSCPLGACSKPCSGDWAL